MIINADDFGISENVDLAIAEAFNRGVINRTTIMVNMPRADAAKRIALENGFFKSVGLHVNLTEGPALTEICRKSELCDENGNFLGKFHVSTKNRFFLNKQTRRAIYAEIEAQIQKYIEMGFTLMHADSHNYVHTYMSWAREYNKLLKKYSFKSVRISRNLPYGDFSLMYGIYKKLYNHLIRNLKIGKRKIETTKYFCSVQDILKQKKLGLPHDIDNTEIMTHPIFKDGVLTDNTLPHPHEFVSNEFVNEYAKTWRNFGKTYLLVTFIQTHIGGAMTSLVNFVNALDTEKYDVDLKFYYREDKNSRYGIKDGINILDDGRVYDKYSLKNLISKFLSPRYVIARIREKVCLLTTKNENKALQIMAREGCRYSLRHDTHYDVAIAYEFSWCMYYTARYVNANKKLLWHHTDFHASKFDYSLDKTTFERFDKLVFVSKETANKFAGLHPELSDKCVHMPNLLSSGYIRQRADYTVEDIFENDERFLKAITVARIDFSSKAFDRTMKVLKRLKDEGLCEFFKYLIIGDGPDFDTLISLINEYGLNDIVKCIGCRENPIPYLKDYDVMLLLSKFEGKPMAVTEAMIMGLVPIVSRYASADEQIKSGFDGIVCDNNEDAIYETLKSILNDYSVLDVLRKNINSRDYGNEYEINVFDDLVDNLIK